MLVDSFGRLLALYLSGGQVSDHKYAPVLGVEAARHRVEMVVGDKGYDSHALRESLRAYKIEPVIPRRGKSKKREKISRKNYRRRNLIERFIGKIKEHRRVATRYDKKAAHYKGFVILAAILNWINIIC